MFSRPLLSRIALPAVLVVAALWTAEIRAQRLEDGSLALQTKAKATRLLRADLGNGKAQAEAKDKTHQEAAEIAAKEVTYPLIWETQSALVPEHGKLNRVFESFDRDILQMTRFKLQTATWQQMYFRQVIDRAREVILAGKPIAGVNAARMLSRIPERIRERGVLQPEKAWVDDVLPRLAEGNAEHLAGVVLGLLETPKAIDGVKYWLYQALASLVAIPPQSPPLLKKETEEKIIHAGILAVDKKVIFPKRTDRSEVEGYKVLRREAIKIVAQARAPALGEKDRPALTLARVAGNDASIQPAPRLDERIEAVAGLARMGTTAGKASDFQPDYAALQIANTVLAFALEAAANVREPAVVRRRPWKVDAARLGEAVEELKGSVKTPYVQTLADKCLLVLRTIENGDPGDANDLGDWLSKNSVPVNSLFKSGPDSTIKPVAVDATAKPGAEK
jgi:hypothetical protein